MICVSLAPALCLGLKGSTVNTLLTNTLKLTNASFSRGGEGSGTPLQSSCLENPMDLGAWRAVVHGVAESGT